MLTSRLKGQKEMLRSPMGSNRGEQLLPLGRREQREELELLTLSS